MAGMLRADLAEARDQWLKAAKRDPQLAAQREQDDFLLSVNHEGELLDFHSLRHTCGAWLATTGVHPKVVQTVMRHQSITLTMDTYGHLFPGQEADAVARMRELLTTPSADPQATCTDDAAAEIPHGARCSWRSSQGAKQCAEGATACDGPASTATQDGASKSFQDSDLGDDMRKYLPNPS